MTSQFERRVGPRLSTLHHSTSESMIFDNDWENDLVGGAEFPAVRKPKQNFKALSRQVMYHWRMSIQKLSSSGRRTCAQRRCEGVRNGERLRWQRRETDGGKITKILKNFCWFSVHFYGEFEVVYL